MEFQTDNFERMSDHKSTKSDSSYYTKAETNPLNEFKDTNESTINDSTDDQFKRTTSDFDEGSNQTKAYLTLVGGVFLMIYLSSFYLWGNISIYVLSYFYQFDPQLSLSFVFLVDFLLVGFQCAGNCLCTYLMNSVRLPVKLVILLGSGAALLGVFFSTYQKTLLPFFTLYCFVNGIGCGVSHMVPLICAWEYFPKKKGLVTGLLMGSYAFGSFFFIILSTKLVNPHKENPTIITHDGNKFFESDVASRVPFMLRTLVCIWLPLVLISILLITRKPQDQVAQEEAQEQQTEEAQQQQERIVHLSKTSDCFFRVRFWQYFFLSYLGSIFLCIFMYSFKIFGEKNGLDDTQLSWVASIGSGLINGLSGLVMGIVSDKVQFKKLMTVLLVSWIAIAASVNWLVQVPWLYFSAVLCNYFCTGGFYAILPIAVNQSFSIKFAPQVYSIILSAGFLSAVTNFLITRFLLQATSYKFLYFFGMGSTTCALILLMTIKDYSRQKS